MYVLLALSIGAVAIVLAKLWQFARCGFRDQAATVEAAVAAALAGDVEGARRTLADCRSPVARVVDAALAGAAGGVDPEAVASEVQRVGTCEIRTLESYLRGLSSIAHLSPLLGLLGTVFGMIDAFRQIETAGSHVSPALLAGGIWEALLTTAFGLAIAVPATAAFFLLEGEVDNVRAAMKDAVTRVHLHARNGGDIEAPRAGGEHYGV